MDFIPFHASTKEAMYISLQDKSKMIEDLQNQINLLNKRLEYLESTFLPIPDEHEILYERVYQENPLYPPGQDKVTLDKVTLDKVTLDNPSSIIEGIEGSS